MFGVVVVLALLSSSGGAAKSRQLDVLSQIQSGRHGAGKRVWLTVAMLLIVFGTCGAFAGVAADDARQSEACVRTCTERGYATGTVRGSEQRDPPGSKRHAFRACVCESGPEPDPLDLRLDELRRDPR
ncbi:MAG: hypothetical protein AB1Z98_32485 [Nannocystaceae bacterium]